MLPEASIARLSADGDNVYVVGVTSLWRVRWADGALTPELVAARYRTLEGQTYGWDCVLIGATAWFLDNGEGAAAFSGTLRGHGVSTAPLHLVRVDSTPATSAWPRSAAGPAASSPTRPSSTTVAVSRWATTAATA